ncbi:MAG: S41 family peptidase [Bacteroidota bacterium]
MKSSPQVLLFLIALLVVPISESCAQGTPPPADSPAIERSLTTQLNRLKDAPLEERIALYHAYKQRHPGANLEEEINLYGYNCMWQGETEEALAFFKLLVEDHPTSANAYDSYAEALMNLGKKEAAIANYEKSLALDPSNFNAEDQIEKIKFPDKKPLSEAEKFTLSFDLDPYKRDLDQLVQDIFANHPNPTKFTSEENWKQVLESKKALLTDETTYAEFSWHCNELAALLNCSHSGMSRFWNENRMLPLERRFPLQTRWIAGQLFVIHPLNNADLVEKGAQILSINGQAVEAIMEDIYRHIVSQGHIETAKRLEFNQFSTGMIAYSLGFPPHYEVSIQGQDQPIQLAPASINPDPARDPTIRDCGGDLCLNYLDTENKIALMSIRSFNYYERGNYDEFVRFVDVHLAELLQHETEHLIIDVRGNGGGSPESSIYLLRHLMKRPFVYASKADFPGKTKAEPSEQLQPLAPNRFDGKLYFLIDGKGNSTTGHFMSLVKQHQLGPIIGEELGSNQFCNAGMKRLRLKHTKLEFHVANNTHISTATSLPDEVGILPDHEVGQSIDEYFSGTDAVKDFAIDLIKQQTNWTPASPYHSDYYLVAHDSIRKELLQIPLSFAPDLKLRGLEDLRFLAGWNDVNRPDFWSYAFAWNLVQEEAMPTSQIKESLETYFDGLMGMERISREKGLPMTKAELHEVERQTGTTSYQGSITTFDGFFQQQIFTLNVQAERVRCKEFGRSVILFRCSPQGFNSPVWQELNQIRIPQDICTD